MIDNERAFPKVFESKVHAENHAEYLFREKNIDAFPKQIATLWKRTGGLHSTGWFCMRLSEEWGAEVLCKDNKWRFWKRFDPIKMLWQEDTKKEEDCVERSALW